MWIQREVQLPPLPRGIHAVTRQIVAALPELAKTRIGLLHVFIQHTSASLTINENADPAVLTDLDQALDTLAPEDTPYAHREEGVDDMPGHIKASLMGCSLVLPVCDGQLRLGTWQAVCLCEHRRHGSGRRLVLTLQGTSNNHDEA